MYMENGGSILYLAKEGGEKVLDSNFNYFLEEFGISVNEGGCREWWLRS